MLKQIEEATELSSTHLTHLHLKAWTQAQTIGGVYFAEPYRFKNKDSVQRELSRRRYGLNRGVRGMLRVRQEVERVIRFKQIPVNMCK